MKNQLKTIARTPFLLIILIAAILISVFFPIAHRYVIYPQYSEFLLENTEEEAIRTARYLSLKLSLDKEGVTKNSLTPELVDNDQETLKALGLMKFKIFSKTGEVLFSTSKKDIGKINKKDYFFEIVTKGNNFTKLVRKNAETLEGQIATLDVVETYVPVFYEGSFAGAFEIYYNITNRVNILERLLFYTSFILIGVAIVLLLVVVWTVRGAAIAIEKRNLARLALISSNEKLEERVKERTRELSFERDRANFANKSKSEFLANMSHELRTPLNSVIAYSEMLMKEMFGPLGSKKNAEYVSDINRSGGLLLEHIGDILDISRIEAGELDLDERQIDLLSIIPSLMSMMAVRAETKNVKIIADVDFSVLSVYFDERQLKQIVINLLSNAVKFTNARGEVRLAVSVTKKDGISIRVTDNGIGIAADDIPKILEPFSQVANSQTRSHEGTGLGLAIVKSLVANHGGTLSISSEVGVGTKVLVEFPIERVLHYQPTVRTINS